jgi:hypothetical protein
MKPGPNYGNRLVFLIKDPNGRAWGIAPSKIEARVQAAWFLPRGIKYTIEPAVIPRDKIVSETNVND